MTAPGTTLVMLPGEAMHAEPLFATERDPSSERSTGRILSPRDVTDATAVKDVRPSRRFDGFVDAGFAAQGRRSRSGCVPRAADRAVVVRDLQSRPRRRVVAASGSRRADARAAVRPRICAGEIPK